MTPVPSTISSIPASSLAFHGGEKPDVLLISRDGGCFLLHKQLLSLHSICFASMFSLEPSPKEFCDGIPVVRMEAETREELELVLPLCYLSPDATHRIASADISSVSRALLLAHKLEMAGAIHAYIEPALRRHVVSDPYRVFALAMAYELGKDLARSAALSTLALTTDPVYDRDFERISGGALIKLVNFRSQCSKETSALASPKDADYSRWIRRGDVPPRVIADGRFSHTSTDESCYIETIRVKRDRKSGSSGMDVRPWWKAYMDRAGTALAGHP